MNKIIKKLITITVISLPVVSFAQADPSGSLCDAKNIGTIGDILGWATCLLSNAVVPLLFAGALAVFVFGVVKFIGNSDSKEQGKGKDFMIWGIVGLFVMISVWGLVNVLNVTFGVRNVIPQLPVTSN